MNSEWCTFSYPMYCECKLVGLIFGCKVFCAYIGYNEGFGMEFGKDDSISNWGNMNGWNNMIDVC